MAKVRTSQLCVLDGSYQMDAACRHDMADGKNLGFNPATSNSQVIESAKAIQFWRMTSARPQKKISCSTPSQDL